ncbi:alpha-1,4-glucan--maltose-1-phosphate maltosyltransferase [Ilumatobacter sp.]|uniref:alpha-1,4-glucan--maltose-1-phosphate maltosyltransferase n=1 Tax=Ilumatobacter sp. TaxID=1967498 RepID=UPI003B5267B9
MTSRPRRRRTRTDDTAEAADGRSDDPRSSTGRRPDAAPTTPMDAPAGAGGAGASGSRSWSAPDTATAATPAAMPVDRPSRTVVEPVAPVVDDGRFAAKASLGRPLSIRADVFTDGHDVVFAEVALTPDPTHQPAADGTSTTVAMRALGNDRFVAVVVPDRLGRWTYDVHGWVSHAETWRRGTVAKDEAGVDVTVEAAIGVELVEAMVGEPRAAATSDDLEALRALRDRLADGDVSTIDDDGWAEVFHRAERRDADHLDRPLRIDVDPVLATVGSWYSFFPRSTADGRTEGSATLRDAIDRLDHIDEMGFDVVYIPPVHPIGRTNRKGRNNSTHAEPGDVGSPYAIGSAEGGHFSVAPELGTVDDVAALAAACSDRGMHLAIDIAFNCSPDHPWVAEHPEWFTARPDGTIQFAENPPKRYEDIYPLDFESSDWQGLWRELADVFRFWIDHGVTIFRVDNPHTKSFAFWDWALSTIRADHPEAIFLSEAFTRPRVMQRLAKVGFNQSYTYFAWRHTSAELREYFEELATETIDFMRPNAWPNTHDILTEHVQTGGRAGFVSRAVLAATLSPSWGVYGPVYELMETAPREGVEDYLDSEKYEVRHWDLDRADSLAPVLGRLNAIRRAHPALGDLASVRFHGADDDALLCFTKTDPAGEGDPVLVVVNVDPHRRAAGFVDVDLAAIGLPYETDYDVVDHLGGATFRWSGARNYVELSPDGPMAHVFTVRSDAASTDGGAS